MFAPVAPYPFVPSAVEGRLAGCTRPCPAVQPQRLTPWVDEAGTQLVIRAVGDILELGMAATADIMTGRRSILSYLMSPIDAARLEAGRER